MALAMNGINLRDIKPRLRKSKHQCQPVGVKLADAPTPSRI
ncbi:hypothetical protein PPRY_a4299 [Pseudoalteromonas prydzensis ACAM 620]|nr:hypothetical protein [Pseudoalteromonas prydzensis ACAM 620]MBE0376675.1 hypothetical protein [Pseudoalteromonas prydzensis ACAM 620]